MVDWSKIFSTAGNIAQTGAAVYGAGADAGLYGNNGGTTQSETKDPWSVAQPYMTDALRQSQDLYRSGQGSEYYPGQGFTPMGSDTSTGLNQMRQRAMDGSPLLDQAKGAMSQIIEGKENPYLDKMYDRGSEGIMDNMKSLYSSAGRYNLGEGEAMTKNIGRSLGDYATNLYGGAYENDANRRMQAIGGANAMAETDYNDATRLLGIGQGIEGYQTAEREADQDKWNFNQQNPYDRLDNYANLASSMGGMGGTYTGDKSTSPSTSTNVGNVFGAIGDIQDIWIPKKVV